MHDDVACIIAEIHRLTTIPTGRPAAGPARPRPFPEPPPAGGPRPGRSLTGPAPAVPTPAFVLRLSVPQRHLLALAAQGYSVGQIAGLTATSTALTDSRLRYAATQLGVAPGFGTAARR